MTERAHAHDVRLARGLREDAIIRRVSRLIDASARGELRSEPFGTADARRRSMDVAVGALLHAHGPGALHALRAQKTLEALHAIAHSVPEPERARRLGRFVEAVSQYGAFVDGVRVAPLAVLRVLFMARLGAITGRLPTDGFSDDDARLYWGWLALHGTNAPIDLRMRALERYGDLGGKNAAEALGVMLHRVGEPRDSTVTFQILESRNGSIRARNYGLAGIVLD